MNISRCKVGLEGEGKIDVMNLKCKPEETFEAREMCEAIVPAYHMNKKHWNQLNLYGNLPDDLVQALIQHSYDEVVKKMSKKQRLALNC